MFKNALKKALYTFYPKNSLSAYNLQLGYIFHTEWIYHQQTFEGLIRFCKQYFELTKAQPICTIMTAVNPLVAHGMKKENCSSGVFIERVHELSQYATIGYHGHFWTNAKNFSQAEYAIHSTTFETKTFLQQFENDLEWFEKSNINHNGVYAGGWWFMNEFLLEQLLKNNFTTDYSFSKAPYFYNAFSRDVMNKNNVHTGESFYLKLENESQKMLCIQNLIGAHDTSFVYDFDRNLKKILEVKNVTGVINAHDYDRNFNLTLHCIEHLMNDANALFYSHDELRKVAIKNELRTFSVRRF